MKKIKCKGCGARFPIIKELRYLAADTINGRLQTSCVYECFDCTKCGCQNTVNLRTVTKVKEMKED